ncbi:DUF1801 domain-containing protein [Chelativorans salis]|uniref:DUF1801 domain-containing protein n=1 Tax=Chelativorans salis TaxID=2978478 RepID=A0ABT2LMW7_9HYPH|nr:DUF1801 domain-containing protein [Chelativorans sp. EGI FJ00035]MCT7375906.1 DUF1801 domain-containing protein [Chelativorans sp. EGI FJ00035]
MTADGGNDLLHPIPDPEQNIGSAMARKHEFADKRVEQAFRAFGEPAREHLMRIRDLIFATAASTSGVGPLEETLKWGQPAYLTSKTKSGSTIRLGIPKSPAHDCAVFVHCQSSLVEQFEAQYPALFSFEGTRALLFKASDPLPVDALTHCIAMALTYHQKKRPARIS